MKKVFGIIILVVVIIMTVCYANAKAEENNGVTYVLTYNEAEAYMDTYADENKLYDWKEGNAIGNVLYGIGLFSTEDFEDMYDCEWSVENFNLRSTEDFEMVEIHTWVIDEIDGITIYRTQAQSETQALGWKNGDPYYCADVIFMVVGCE